MLSAVIGLSLRPPVCPSRCGVISRFKNTISQNYAFYIVLQIIHFLNLQCNVLLTHGASALAELLVIYSCNFVTAKHNMQYKL